MYARGLRASGGRDPGVVPTREMYDGVVAAWRAKGYMPLSAAQMQAIVLPLMPEGDAPQCTPGAPPSMPILQPGASPAVPAALPAQPSAQPVGGGETPAAGTVQHFPWGLPRFRDSNPPPLDGWALDDKGFAP